MNGKTILFRTKNLHRDNGEVESAVVACTPGKPLEILSDRATTNINLPAEVHVALAACDLHVHFRESAVPTLEEFNRYRYHETDYHSTRGAVHNANLRYDVYRGSLAALNGGVWLVGCMGNTPWAPVGTERWLQTMDDYRRHALVYTHVWPRMEPDVPPVAGQESKDFGSTFGGSGLSQTERRTMYELYRGSAVRYHNDDNRPDMSIKEFARTFAGPPELLHHCYFDGNTVLFCQRETIALARECGLKSLLTCHIPTGPALQMILDERAKGDLLLPAEVGLDYLYWNRDMLKDRPTGLINYRRPALPSAEDQASLIELTRSLAGDSLTMVASDHAPHTWEAKQFKAGLPGSPGTRLLEISTQLHTQLVRCHGFSYHDIDRLTAINPVGYAAQFLAEKFAYPIGTMANGAMANLRIFDPTKPYQIDESRLAAELGDPHYHSAYREEKLFGQIFFTVVDGCVWDVTETPTPLN